jgi:hypothetical protein
MTDFQIVNEKDGRTAIISPLGEVVVAPISYSTAYYMLVDSTTDAFEVVPGLSGKRFVITSILFASDRNFGSATTPENMTLYEAHPSDLATNLATVASIDFLKNDRLSATQLNIQTEEGVALVAIADDTNIGVTVAGYYIDHIHNV